MVALSLFGDSYLYAVLPIYYTAAGVSLAQVGWLLSINRYIRLLTNPLAGAAGSRLGWGAAFAAALWLGAATTAGYGLLRGFLIWMLLRALWGGCWSFLKLGGMAAVLADSATGQRGRLMGLFTGVFRIGSLAATAAGGLLADRLGFTTTALIFGGITAIGAAVSTLQPARDGRWGAPAQAAAVPGGGVHHNWLPVGGPEWAACLSAGALQLVVSGIVTATVGLLVKQRLGTTIAVGPLLLGAAGVSGLLLGSRFAIDLILGPLLGHWGDRRGRGPVLTLTTGVLVLALLALGQATSLWLIAPVLVLFFAAGTGATAVLDAWAGDLAGRAPGRFLPAYTTWADFGAATGPVLGYYLSAHVGLPLAYATGAALLVVAWGAQSHLSRR